MLNHSAISLYKATHMADFDNLLFNIDITPAAPAPGSLLVAEPFLRDEYFAHSVVCLVDYEPAGEAMGVVLNHPTPYTLQQLLADVKSPEPVRVYCGGPMSADRLYYIHTLGPDIVPGCREIKQGLYIGGDFKAMTDYVNSGYPVEGAMRFFIGYSGWSRRQLDEEIDNRVWAVTPGRSRSLTLTGSGDAYWHSTVRAMGSTYRGWLYHPQNPSAN